MCTAQLVVTSVYTSQCAMYIDVYVYMHCRYMDVGMMYIRCNSKYLVQPAYYYMFVTFFVTLSIEEVVRSISTVCQ